MIPAKVQNEDIIARRSIQPLYAVMALSTKATIVMALLSVVVLSIIVNFIFTWQPNTLERESRQFTASHSLSSGRQDRLCRH